MFRIELPQRLDKLYEWFNEFLILSWFLGDRLQNGSRYAIGLLSVLSSLSVCL